MDLLARLKAFYWALPSRRARPAPVLYNLAKTLGQTLLMWTAFLVIGPFIAWQIESYLLRHSWPLARFAAQPTLASALFVFGWLVAWWSAWALVRWGDGTPLPVDATNKLVVRGPYRWVRNPMASSSLLQGAAIGLGAGSPLILLYIVAGALGWNFLARPWEEADMRARFGADFERYRQNVRCWVPCLSPYED